MTFYTLIKNRDTKIQTFALFQQQSYVASAASTDGIVENQLSTVYCKGFVAISSDATCEQIVTSLLQMDF